MAARVAGRRAIIVRRANAKGSIAAMDCFQIAPFVSFRLPLYLGTMLDHRKGLMVTSAVFLAMALVLKGRRSMKKPPTVGPWRGRWA